MNKQEFLECIRRQLEDLPEEDVQKSLDYYSEMIEDRIEEGLTEEDAVKEIGTPDEAVTQILMDTSFTKLVKAKVKPKKRLSVWAIVLIILGSPIWFPLLMAVLSIVFVVYIVIWSVILVLYSVDLSLAAAAVGSLVTGAAFTFHFGILEGLYVFGTSIVCAGLAVLLFFGSNQVTKGIIFLSKKIAFGIKYCFVGRSKANE